MSSFPLNPNSSKHRLGFEAQGQPSVRRLLHSTRSLLPIPPAAMLAVGLLGFAGLSNAQTVIFSENLGTPTGTTTIVTYAGGTAPATFQNKGTLTYGIGEQTTADVRTTSASNAGAVTYTGASGNGNVFFAASGTIGFSIESINASAYNTLQLSYGYRKENASLLPTFSVEYWNGSSWVVLQNTASGLFNEAANATAGWYVAKTISLPAGAQVSGLKIRFVKSGSQSLRIDDIKLTGTPAAGDVTKPTIASLSPVNTGTNVAITANAVASFSEAIQAGTGTILLQKTSDSSTVPASVVVAGSTVTIDPTSNLEYSTNYTVIIPPGSIKDLANNNFDGTPETGSWSFTTVAPDNTAPTITSVTPAIGATGIARPSALTITFSENIQVASSGSPKIYIKRVSDDQIASQVESGSFGTASATNNVATVPISPPLDYGTQYYVEIDSGAFEDVSPNNNDFTGLSKFIPETTTYSWNFTLLSVPSLTNSGPYLQDFSGFTSSATFPSGWAVTSSGSAPAKLDYSAWNTTTTPNTTTGIKFSSATPVTNVFGYQHTGDTDSVDQILNLTNGTGAEITDLTISYRGRRSRDNIGRTPAYTVTLNYGANSVPIPALAYVTSDGDNLLKTASLTGLTIPVGGSFSITWNSNGDTAVGSGSREQIGISDVSVESGAATFPPSVAGVTPSYSSLSQNSVTVGSAVSSDGGSPITERGIVYSLTSVDATPQSGESGVTKIADVSTEVGAFSLPITGLTPGSQYSVASYATNAEGTTHSSAVTIFTLPAIPLLSSQYSQAFDNFTGSIVNGTLPAGWSVVSSGGLNSYAGTWGPSTSSGGLVGGVTPGVLGYQHVGGSATVTASLSLKNNTGTTLTQLYVSYLGRVSRADQSREPAWTFSLNGTPVTELDYSTSAAVDATKAKLVTGLSIAPDDVITLTWVSDGNVGTGGARRQIGIGEVLVAVPTAPVLGSASASSITGTTATLNGNVTADGYLPITARGFVYSITGTNADPQIGGLGVTDVVEGGTTTGSYNSPVTGLNAATGYSLKAYATNSAGTTYSNVATFSTGAAGLSYDTWNDSIDNQAANLDFDGDGISNGVEFFMGTPGNAFTVNPGISAGTVTWPRASGTLITSFKVEVSTDLTNWTDASVTYPGSVSAPSNSPVTFTLPSGPTSLFIRLNVTP